MELIQRYLIVVYVVLEAVDKVVEAVKEATDFAYGNYKWVYWKSAEGIEYFNEANEDEVNSNPAIKLEFSISKNDALLEEVLNKIVVVHPWKEPVIRICEIQETRANS
jgi:hypothetical protein